MGWRASVVVVVVRSRSFGVFGVDDGYIDERGIAARSRVGRLAGRLLGS